MENILILCTINDINKAKEISKTLVEKKLIACANIFPNVISIYSWENKIQEEDEFLILMKSKKDYYEKIEKEILKIHPYITPEIIMLTIEKGHKNYLDWIEDSIKH